MLCKIFTHNLLRTPGYDFNFCQPSRLVLITSGFILALFISHPGQALELQKLPLKIEAKKIVEPLPWSFNMTRENMSGKNFPYLDTTLPPDSLKGFRFVSRNPIQQGNSRGTYLRITFYSGRFGNSNEAREQFKNIKNSADPNIGLSYQWDFVSRSGPFIYHIHADCLLAEEHFLNLTQSLTDMIDPEGKSQLDQMHCRCGGGCQFE